MEKFNKYIKIVFLIILSLTPVFWLIGRKGILIDGIDTNFPLNPTIWFSRRFYVWTAVSNAGADFSASTAGTFFHFLQFLPFKLGFPLQIVEIISLVFWFSLIIFGSYFLATIILPKKNVPQLIFVALYSFNIYLFNSWENVKVANLALVAAIPIGISILLLLREKKISRGTASILAIINGIILSGAGINPAYIICFFLILTILLISEVLFDFGNIKQVFNRIVDFLIVSIFIVLVNFYWILPTIHFIFSTITASNSINKLGFTNWVDSLSENTSLVNVIRMIGAWDWYPLDASTNLPLYIPYATRYFFNPIFVSFSFLIPSLAFLAFVFRKKKINLLYFCFALMLVFGIFLTSGTHAPTGGLFAFFSRHIPFFTLFRSPWYIFGTLVALPIAGLASLFFYNLEEFKINKHIVNFFGIIFLFGILIYSYPLLLGKIFRPSRPDNFYTNFPSYVYEARDWLAKTPSNGRIVSYPDDNIEKFNWGYSAVDSILNLMSDREVVYSSLNDTTSPFARALSEFYTAVKKNEIVKATSIANVMGVNQLFYKEDQQSLSPKLPNEITKNKIISFGKWGFYKFPEGADNKKIFSANCCLLSYPYESSYKNLPLVDNNILVSDNDSLFKNSNLLSSSGIILYASNSQLNDFNAMDTGLSTLSSRLITRDLSKVEFNFQMPQAGIYKPILEKYGLDSFGVIDQNKLNIIVDGKPQVWIINKSDDSYLYFNPILLDSGKHIATIQLTNKNLIDINNYSKAGNGIVDFSNGEIAMSNKSNKDLSLNFKLTQFDPAAFYLVNISYKQIYGNNAAVLMDQRSNTTLFKDSVERLPNYPEWGNFSFYYHPVIANSSLYIDIEAPFTQDALGTKVLYKDLAVNKVFSNDLFFEKDSSGGISQPEVNFSEQSPVLYSGTVINPKGPHIIVFNENYSPLWQLKINGNNNAKVFHFTSNTYQNAWYIEGTDASYKFSIMYNPQSYLKIGYFISGLGVLISLIYFVHERIKKTK